MVCVAVLGPTASGKSRLAMSIAEEMDGEIVSIDSRQAYRGLDIGTSKPSAEDIELVPHHMLNILDLHEKNDAERYARAARIAIGDILDRGRLPVLVGGSGLYFRAISEGLFSIDLDHDDRRRFALSVKGISTDELHGRLSRCDPEAAGRIHPNDRYRIVRALEVHELTGIPLSHHFEMHSSKREGELEYVKIGIDLPRARLHERINARTEEMIEAGWIEETRALLESGIDPSCPGFRTLGYPEVISHVRGEITLESLVETIQKLTRQYAKRQMTWFRKEPGLHWLQTEGEQLETGAFGIIKAGA